ncbi:hypothetical protein [Flaviflexus huanghaiensis]|uniref:hypothetical protein n=1 Tax=Flaviflexus huanghaiensis TaxID=1111473 RepID=UPI0015FA0095|nr:hypothetical protein [Flaviflexus huanghaiensis]
MTLTDFGRSMLRRWYVVVICLALTAAGAFAVARSVEVTYESTATVVLLPPPSVVTEEGNPYLFMGGLDQALSVLAVKLNSADVAETLVNGGESYSVAKDPIGPGPLINITAEAGSGPRSEALRDAILDRLPNDLQELQDGLSVASASRIGAMTVVQSDEPTRMAKEQTRAILTVAALGIGLTVWVAAVVDRSLLARAARKRAQAETEETSEPDQTQAKSHDKTRHSDAVQTKSDDEALQADERQEKPDNEALHAHEVQAKSDDEFHRDEQSREETGRHDVEAGMGTALPHMVDKPMTAADFVSSSQS